MSVLLPLEQRPRLVTLESRARKRAVLFAGWRPRSLVDWLWMQCFMATGIEQLLFRYRSGRLESYDTDVLIIGANPLLNLVALFNAARSGYRAIACPVEEVDPWPYGLLERPAFLYFLTAATGARLEAATPTLIPDEVDALLRDGLMSADQRDPLDVAFRLVAEETLRLRRAELLRTDACYAPGLCLTAPEGEEAVFMRDRATSAARYGQLQSAGEGAGRAHLLARLPRLAFGPGPDAMRVVFARRIVLTSRVTEFMDFEAMSRGEVGKCGRLLLLGSARPQPEDRIAVLHQAVDDIFRALAPLPLAGGAAVADMPNAGPPVASDGSSDLTPA